MGARLQEDEVAGGLRHSSRGRLLDLLRGIDGSDSILSQAAFLQADCAGEGDIPGHVRLDHIEI